MGVLLLSGCITPADGDIKASELASFEAPDPAFWVPNDYVVVAVDSRGMGASGGTVRVLELTESEDFYDAIEWAGAQPWSTGKVGLTGVSYHGLIQWRTAALKPPSLSAIIPWEGLTDLYREGAYHGGISSTFIDGWFNYRILKNRNSETTPYRDLRTEINNAPLLGAKIHDDLKIFDALANITIPVYAAVSIQDHGLHTRGTIKGFENIASEHKWLELHGRKKWEYYYSPGASSRQKMFFDQFLKGENSGILQQPRVIYEMREEHYKGSMKTASTWPIPNRRLKKLYLQANTLDMTDAVPRTSATTDFSAAIPVGYDEGDASQTSDDEKSVFTYAFSQDTEIVGSIKLNLFVSSTQSNDIDLFVGIQKEDASGTIKPFQGPAEEGGQIASGWLRVSHRALDKAESTEEIPVHSHLSKQLLRPNQKVEVQVEVWPTTAKFFKNEKLRLVVQARDIVESQEKHKELVGKGRTVIHTGPSDLSYLQIPVLQ